MLVLGSFGKPSLKLTMFMAGRAEGPVGLAALMLAKSMGANKLIGVDVVEERLEVTQKLGLADHVLKAGVGNAY